jgi:hypothetical protein
MNQNEIMFKSLPDSYIKKMRDYWKPGRVIFCYYSQSYDLVVAFHEEPYEYLFGVTWSVDVIACNSFGEQLKDAVVRNHCIQPSEMDKIIRDI